MFPKIIGPKDMPKVKLLVQVHCPVVISSALSEVLDTQKLVKYYERLCAFTYTRYIVNEVTQKASSSEIMDRLVSRYAPLITITTALAYPLAKFFYVLFRSRSIQKASDALFGYKPMLESEETKLRKRYESKHKQGLLYESDTSNKIDITEVVIDKEHLVLQYYAHIVEDKFFTTPKQVLVSSAAKNMQNIISKTSRIMVTPHVDLITLSLNVLGYMITTSEEEELEDHLASQFVNKVVVDFSTDVVRSELSTPHKKYKFVALVKDVLSKPNVENITLSDLVSLLKGTKQV